MASAWLSHPGSLHGPCLTPCTHRDCAETRKMARTICRFCHQKIGYDRDYTRNDSEFMLTGDSDLCHAACLEDHIALKKENES